MTDAKIALPGVFQAPLRLDIAQFVFANINKNRRQAHGVNVDAGMKHSAESWGTGRAVARIPRVSGSGTHRSGQAAFGNMCRKGRMFAPLKTWRRWHRKVNLRQKRHAAATAVAASAITPLVLARGHRVENVPQLPLVVEDKLESIEKTKEAVAFLKQVGAYTDVQRVVASKKMRAGKGKLRNRRFRQRRGPLVVHAHENVKLVQALRNVPGVEVCHVSRMNLLQLAPGGQLGRFIIWTQSAFQQLDKLFGSHSKPAVEKKGYQLNRPCMTNPDLQRLVNSNEIQSALNPIKVSEKLHTVQKKNPLVNKTEMHKLNPHKTILRAAETKANQEGAKKRQDLLAAKRGFKKTMTADQKKALKDRKKQSKKFMANITSHLEAARQVDIEEYEHLLHLLRDVQETEVEEQ